MALLISLREKKTSILKRWFELISNTYKGHASLFLQKEKDRFANPVGNAISTGIDSLFDEIIGEGDAQKLSGPLEQIIKIRAIQEFTPSEAVTFVFLLKQAILEKLNVPTMAPVEIKELMDLERRIDGMALLAFDIHIKCREQMYQLRVNELRRRSDDVVDRINRMYEKRQRKEVSNNQESSSKQGGEI